MKRLFSFSLLTSFILASLIPAPAQARQAVTAIRTRAVVDVVNSSLIDKAVVLLRGNHIEAVGTDVEIPPGATIIDLSDLYLLPGLIDAHTHVAITPDYASNNPILNKSIPYRTTEAVAAAKETLLAGFTTIRDLDSEGADWVDVAVRDAIKNGVIPGPRMQVATLAISITGGYMNNDGLAPQIEVQQFGALADSPAAIVSTLRRQIKYGADWIKLYATGTTRHISLEDMEPLAQFSDDDIRLVVREAARFRTPVAAHAYGGHAAFTAVEAGVRSIEHGMLLNDETLDLMVQKGTFWIPTITVYYPGTGEVMTARQKAITDSHRRVFARALARGIKIGYGTDAGALPHGDNAVDFSKMVEYGMSPASALRAATVVNAELMQLSGRIGSVEAGHLADMIAVDSNPLEDITALSRVSFVMKDGVRYK